jgi:predicted transcriptional regulator
MTRTQIQLPDELYQRAKAFAAEREISLAEIARRGIEQFMARFPEKAPKRKKWQLPRVNGGGIKVPLAELHAVAAEEESTRGLRRR